MNDIIFQNEYNGTKKPQRKIEGGQFSLDFAYSQDAVEVDAGIRETIRGVKLSIMAMGIALYRVDVAGLFIDLGFKKFGEYVDHLLNETGMSRSNLYNWAYIGEAYIKNRADLDKIGFTDDDGPTKLPYLGRALENHPKREVFKNLKDMSRRQFEEWSKEQPGKNDKKRNSIRIIGSQVFIGKNPIISFADGMTAQERRYYEGLVLEGAIAARQNEYAKVYRFYDATEARRFDKFYQKELKTLRTKK
jgi:hypothetical protein